MTCLRARLPFAEANGRTKKVFRPTLRATTAVPDGGLGWPGNLEHDWKACNETVLCTPGARSISNCSACAHGKYQPASLAASCMVCASGRYTNSTASVECLLCPRGKTLEDSGSVASAHDSASDCNDCPVLTYSPFLGHGEACFPCASARTMGSTECEGCNPGKKSIKVGGNDTCVACAPGSFVEENQACLWQGISP